MKVDTEKIEWLLKNATQYNISKNTGVAQATISNIINGKRELKNLTIEVGSKLTEYADQLQKQNN
jgi:DNA-binding protein|nr:MAG TPA: DNA-binding protein [Caudoviricetes sp.]